MKLGEEGDRAGVSRQRWGSCWPEVTLTPAVEAQVPQGLLLRRSKPQGTPQAALPLPQHWANEGAGALSGLKAACEGCEWLRGREGSVGTARPERKITQEGPVSTSFLKVSSFLNLVYFDLG